MTLEGKKIGILVEAGFEDSELMVPLEAMKKAGARVVVIGNDLKQLYQGKRGNAEIKADITADRVRADQFDAIIVPGGYAPDRMRLHQPMIALVNKAHRLGKIIAAICHGPQLLISAGIVRGRRLTSWPSITIDLRNAGAHWVNEPVVIDRNIITSRKPADLPVFNKAIKEALTQVNGNTNGKATIPVKRKVKIQR